MAKALALVTDIMLTLLVVALGGLFLVLVALALKQAWATFVG